MIQSYKSKKNLIYMADSIPQSGQHIIISFMSVSGCVSLIVAFGCPHTGQICFFGAEGTYFGPNPNFERKLSTVSLPMD